MAAASATLAAPPDIRLMNNVAALLFALAVVALLAAGAGALARLPVFSIQSVRIDGEVARNSAATIRANAMPQAERQLLHARREAGAARRSSRCRGCGSAVVRRVWPNRLAVRLEEHRALAQWGDDEPAGQHAGRGVRRQPRRRRGRRAAGVRRARRQPAQMLAMHREAGAAARRCAAGAHRARSACRAAARGAWRSTPAPRSSSAAAARRRCSPAPSASCARSRR